MAGILDRFKLNGRTAIVTGGAGLLGVQFCTALSQAGANVVIADLHAKKASKHFSALKGKILTVDTDITSPKSVSALIDKTLKTFGSVDVLVNSAAIDPKFGGTKAKHTETFEDYPLAVWKQALEVNLTGMFLCSQAVTKPMLKQKRGVIINLSSIYGVVAPDQRLYQKSDGTKGHKPAWYSATKAGVLGLTQHLAAYFSGKNIRVNALTPGGVYHKHDDAFVKRYAARAVLGRMGRSDDMNGAIVFLASDASAYMTGANLVVDGGWTAW